MPPDEFLMPVTTAAAALLLEVNDNVFIILPEKVIAEPLMEKEVMPEISLPVADEALLDVRLLMILLE